MNKWNLQNLKWQIPLAIALLLFGFLLMAQYRTQIEIGNSLNFQKTEDLVTIVKSLDEKRTNLEAEYNELQKTYEALLEKQQAGESLNSNLEKEIIQLEMALGTVAVTGPGITVTISGDSNLIATDLVDIVNELWVTGAEAVAINDIRYDAYTSITEEIGATGGSMITVNGYPLLYPVVIKAIGNADTLEKGLTFTGGIIDNLNTLYKVYPQVKKEESITIPARSEKRAYQYIHKPETTGPTLSNQPLPPIQLEK